MEWIKKHWFWLAIIAVGGAIGFFMLQPTEGELKAARARAGKQAKKDADTIDVEHTEVEQPGPDTNGTV